MASPVITSLAGYQTRAVLAGAYKSRVKTTLTHAAELNEAGREIAVLCGRVKVESLADECATDPFALPTCRVCRSRVQRYYDHE